ncbi:Cnl2/NKP2 family protein-domain-containing protein [Ampelomyces quisqualis]|uniref:Cnl2/NKP2 family protein-domain-containing protein n=1 Tax=Ampelomyces quisqualis TaxID=50730 RepID=A0A6A5QP03_AMPQU|nr:Cnl2/NKP2 family protein-domain-containing protein [Ampelomyces quisqualis]
MTRSTAMPPREAKLLSEFLLDPAPLRDFMPPGDFTDIFPKAHRANPAVQDVYRELQRLREKDMDVVRRAIADEIARSKRLRREYASERRRQDEATVAGLDPAALRIEEELWDHGRHKAHTLTSVHTSIEQACRSLELQITEAEAESARALAEVQEVVGALSDLRSGRFAQPASGEDLGEEVLATLKRLEAVCAETNV